MSLQFGQDFFDYARLSEGKEQKNQHTGVIVVQPQVNQFGDPGYIPMDLTVGIIDRIIIYPVSHENRDLPGRTGGPQADFDNSLTYEGATDYISAPMVAIVAAPDHAKTIPTETTCDYNNLRNEHQGDTGTVKVILDVPPTNVSLTENLANLVPIDAAFEYWNGSTWVAVSHTRRWDLANVFEFDITLPADNVGQFKIRSTFASGVVEDDYRFTFELYIDSIIRFTEYDVFEVTA